MVTTAPSARRSANEALTAVLLTLAALVGIALAAQRTLDLSPRFTLAAPLLFAGGGAALVLLAARHLPASFGPANRVTLSRAALTALVFGLLGETPSPGAAWFATAVAGLALALDGLDGRLARGRGVASPFGARFDMETDALLILGLAALAWRFDKAGPWILLAGLLRYAFVAAGAVWPWMRRPLPPSRRRQAVCVVQIATLILCLVPLSAQPWSAYLAFAGLAALTASFAADVAWLARRRGTAP
ncbi:MAG TPA: CDP-alcohol phosphatidyltransferase family protein [Gammaproteobacteria bacterium]